MIKNIVPITEEIGSLDVIGEPKKREGHDLEIMKAPKEQRSEIKYNMDTKGERRGGWDELGDWD